MIPEAWMKGPLMWVAFLVPLSLILCWGVWDLATEQAEQRVKSEQSAEDHIEYAKDRIEEKCLTIEPVPLRDCIYEEIESARDHDRANQDLDAQRAMALFTKIMGATALLGVVLGAVSVVLIYMTLSETQRMVNETQKIGEAQTRAYISRTRGGVWPGVGLEFELEVRNTGNSPAFDCHIIFELEYVVRSEDQKPRIFVKSAAGEMIPAQGPRMEQGSIRNSVYEAQPMQLKRVIC